jgi:hypothetical protein
MATKPDVEHTDRNRSLEPAVRSRKWALAGVGAGALLGVGFLVGASQAGWLEQGAVDVALESVAGGDLDKGCPALEKALADPNGAEPVASEKRISDAVADCVDHAIDRAASEENKGLRERKLLALAAPGAHLYPNEEQRQRIAEETAELPGAIVDERTRFHPYRYEVRGPLATKELRQVVRWLDVPIRGCHARVASDEPDHTGRYMIRMLVRPDGSVRDVQQSLPDESPVQSDALTACLRALFSVQTFPAKDRQSEVGVEMRIRPFATDDS